jgi:hypothetical protein
MKLRALCAHILVFSYTVFEDLVIWILNLNAHNKSIANSKNLRRQQGKQESRSIET